MQSDRSARKSNVLLVHGTTSGLCQRYYSGDKIRSWPEITVAVALYSKRPCYRLIVREQTLTGIGLLAVDHRQAFAQRKSLPGQEPIDGNNTVRCVQDLAMPGG